MQHHLASSKRAGFTREDWEALKSPAANPKFTDKEKPALAYAEKLTRTPTNDAAREADAARKHCSDEEFVDLTALIALANLTNRMTDGLALDFEGTPEKV